MTFYWKGLRISLSFWFFCGAVLLLTADRSGLSGLFFLAIALHEGGHLLYMLLARLPLGEISLTPLEFSILWYLCARRGKVVSSEELFEAVWGERYLDNNNTVMAHIARLREKLHEPPRRPRFVKTIWGVGYTVE